MWGTAPTASGLLFLAAIVCLGILAVFVITDKPIIWIQNFVKRCKLTRSKPMKYPYGIEGPPETKIIDVVIVVFLVVVLLGILYAAL